MEELLAVGKIVNTHGLKGEVKVISLSDDDTRFKKLKDVYIDGKKEKIIGFKLQPGRVVLKIEGVETIEEAQKLRNKLIEVTRENAIKLPEDTHFVVDLIGCTIYDEDKNDLGKIFDVLFTGSNDVYWVKGKEELLIPVLKDIVLDINIETKTVIIKNVEKWQ
jgi:16S rRNA processing protein RimM